MKAFFPAITFSAFAVLLLSQPTVQAGQVIWPCSASITSSYGPRSSPCAGCSTYHYGVDLGVGSGTLLGAVNGGSIASYAWDSCGGNIMTTNLGNGWQSRFLHLSGSVAGAGQAVTVNQNIAKSGNTGSCTTGAHLHFEMRKDGVAQSIPGSAGTWVTRGTFVPKDFAGLNPPAATLRIAVLTTGADLRAKDGFYGAWFGQLGGVTKFDVDGNRIGALANKVLYVKEGLQGAWTNQIGNAADFQLCGNRIAVLLVDGTLTCKDGIYGSWYNQLGGVTKFHLNGDRIGVIAGGVLYVKQGLQGGWTTQTGSDITALQLCGDRIAALTQAGTLLCKDGLYGAWYSQLGGVTKFSIDGNRIGVIAGGVLYVKEGLQGGWTTQTGSDIVALQLSGDRIGAITQAGTLLCKDGLYGSWFSQIGGVSAFQLKGNRIGAVSGGMMTIKEGLQGGWVNQTDNSTASFKLTEY